MSGKFKILQLRLTNIGDEMKDLIGDKKLTSEENNQLSTKLKDFVKLHIESIEICEILSRAFAPIIFIHFVASAIMICGCCLMLFLAPSVEKTIYLTFAFGGFTDVLLHTYSGHCIILASEDISVAAYNLDWHNYDLKNQKLILMIMTRAQKASAVRIPFFSVSLETYIKVSI